MDVSQLSFGIVASLVLVALAFDFMNGFHDAANSIATVVSTRVLTPYQAVIRSGLNGDEQVVVRVERHTHGLTKSRCRTGAVVGTGVADVSARVGVNFESVRRVAVDDRHFLADERRRRELDSRVSLYSLVC